MKKQFNYYWRYVMKTDEYYEVVDMDENTG